MSSRCERRVTLIILMVEALADFAQGDGLGEVREAAWRLSGEKLAKYDSAMWRVIRKLQGFLGRTLTAGPDGYLTDEALLSYLHLLAAVLSEQMQDCPPRPAARKRGWLRLNNAVAGLISGLADGGGLSGDIGAEVGCRWADEVDAMLRGA